MTKGFPGRALAQALCLTAADPGLSSPSCTSVASVSGQVKPSLVVGKNAFNPILQDHTLQSQLLRLPAAGLLVEAVMVGFPKPAGLLSWDCKPESGKASLGKAKLSSSPCFQISSFSLTIQLSCRALQFPMYGLLNLPDNPKSGYDHSLRYLAGPPGQHRVTP